MVPIRTRANVQASGRDRPRPWRAPSGARPHQRRPFSAIPVVEAGRAARDHVTASRQLYAAAALLGASVLADSLIEHYRGSFRNRAMYLPLAASTLSLLSSGHGAADGARRPRSARRSVYGFAAAIGLTGIGFHLFNVLKREGGLSWLNLFYGAPIGAPAALTLSGLYGLAAERLPDTPANTTSRPLDRPTGRELAAFTAAAMAGTAAEAGLLHFRGAFQNPAMYAPVTLPPIASALMGAAALRRHRGSHRLTRFWLWLTGVMGLAGTGFHAFGVSRAMGGWRNWQQNMVDGPPLPAPPSFAALALAAFAALSMIERSE
jgi:hypothetical protein